LRPRAACLTLVFLSLATATGQAWGPQGHRVVARIAEARLSPAARQTVARLIGRASLADVSTWADAYRSTRPDTGRWHYVNIPIDARAYNRDRDCPRASRAAAGADDWRDCVVDRIREQEARLSSPTLGPEARTLALKFLVHLVADLHQPFHATGLARGANDIAVSMFGSPTCSSNRAATARCTLHDAWDHALIAHRALSDGRYLTALAPRLSQPRAAALLAAPPELWAAESLALAKTALVPTDTDLGERYYRAQIDVVDERLVLAGLRLAALLNSASRE
jgi:hypothetical protein